MNILSLAKQIAAIEDPEEDEELDFESFFYRLYPEYNLEHLRPMIDALLQTQVRPTRCVISVPPQSGKSTVATAFLAWLHLFKSKQNVYATYSQSQAFKIAGRICRAYSGAFKKTLSESTSHWTSRFDSEVIFTSVGGTLTGNPVSGVLIVDDYCSNLQDAESETIRATTEDWFKSVALTRCHKNASVIVICTRWHKFDLSQFAIDLGYDYINVPALSENDTVSYWPKEKPVEMLIQRKRDVGEYVWESLYQGRPLGKQTALFKEFHDAPRPQEIPDRVIIGIDSAYTESKNADFSAFVVLGVFSGKKIVLESNEVKQEIKDWIETLKGLQSKYPEASIVTTGAGQEASVIKLMNGVNVQFKHNNTPKYVRAVRTSTMVNNGEIRFVPGNAKLILRLQQFVDSSGIDDLVDALVNAVEFDCPKIQKSTTLPKFTRRF